MFEENDRLGSFCLFSRCISLVFLLRRCFRMFQVYFLGPNTSSQGVWKPRVCFLRRRYLRILNLARKCMGLLVFRFKWVFGICLGSRSFIQRDWRMFAEGMSVWQPFSVLDILVCEPQRSYPPSCLQRVSGSRFLWPHLFLMSHNHQTMATLFCAALTFLVLVSCTPSVGRSKKARHCWLGLILTNSPSTRSYGKRPPISRSRKIAGSLRIFLCWLSTPPIADRFM